MELRWLEDYVALARTLHFSRAAEEQNVTQPTLSRRIKLLEEEMGTTLINRQTLPLSLTPAGEEFLVFCQEVTRRRAVTRQRIAHLAKEQAGQLRLAAPKSLLAHFLPKWLEKWPPPLLLTPHLHATNWLVNDYLRGLEKYECDLALCYWPDKPCAGEPECSDFLYQLIGYERLIPVSLPDMNGRPRHPLEMNLHVALIAYHPNGLTDSAIWAHLAQQGLSAEFKALSKNVQSGNIRELIELGYGMGWLPERSVQEDIEKKILVRAGDSRWDIPMEIRLYRHRNNVNAGVEVFWEALTKSSPSI